MRTVSSVSGHAVRREGAVGITGHDDSGVSAPRTSLAMKRAMCLSFRTALNRDEFIFACLEPSRWPAQGIIARRT